MPIDGQQRTLAAVAGCYAQGSNLSGGGIGSGCGSGRGINVTIKVSTFNIVTACGIGIATAILMARDGLINN